MSMDSYLKNWDIFEDSFIESYFKSFNANPWVYSFVQIMGLSLWLYIHLWNIFFTNYNWWPYINAVTEFEILKNLFTNWRIVLCIYLEIRILKLDLKYYLRIMYSAENLCVVSNQSIRCFLIAKLKKMTGAYNRRFEAKILKKIHIYSQIIKAYS